MTTADQPYTAITAVLQDYFDGLYHSDTRKLRVVFHPLATYSCATERPILHMGMSDYFALVDKRPAPAASKQVRRDRIVSMEIAGPDAAFVRAECQIGPRFCTDLLTLVRVEGRWQIMAKVFEYTLTDEVNRAK